MTGRRRFGRDDPESYQDAVEVAGVVELPDVDGPQTLRPQGRAVNEPSQPEQPGARP